MNLKTDFLLWIYLLFLTEQIKSYHTACSEWSYYDYSIDKCQSCHLCDKATSNQYFNKECFNKTHNNPKVEKYWRLPNGYSAYCSAVDGQTTIPGCDPPAGGFGKWNCSNLAQLNSRCSRTCESGRSVNIHCVGHKNWHGPQCQENELSVCKVPPGGFEKWKCSNSADLHSHCNQTCESGGKVTIRCEGQGNWEGPSCSETGTGRFTLNQKASVDTMTRVVAALSAAVCIAALIFVIKKVHNFIRRSSRGSDQQIKVKVDTDRQTGNGDNLYQEKIPLVVQNGYVKKTPVEIEIEMIEDAMQQNPELQYPAVSSDQLDSAYCRICDVSPIGAQPGSCTCSSCPSAVRGGSSAGGRAAEGGGSAADETAEGGTATWGTTAGGIAGGGTAEGETSTWGTTAGGTSAGRTATWGTAEGGGSAAGRTAAKRTATGRTAAGRTAAGRTAAGRTAAGCSYSSADSTDQSAHPPEALERTVKVGYLRNTNTSQKLSSSPQEIDDHTAETDYQQQISSDDPPQYAASSDTLPHGEGESSYPRYTSTSSGTYPTSPSLNSDNYNRHRSHEVSSETRDYESINSDAIYGAEDIFCMLSMADPAPGTSRRIPRLLGPTENTYLEETVCNMRLQELVDNADAMFYLSIRMDPEGALDAVAHKLGMDNRKIRNITECTRGEGNTTRYIFRWVTRHFPKTMVYDLVEYMVHSGRMDILQVLKYFHERGRSRCPACSPIFQRHEVISCTTNDRNPTEITHPGAKYHCASQCTTECAAFMSRLNNDVLQEIDDCLCGEESYRILAYDLLGISDEHFLYIRHHYKKDTLNYLVQRMKHYKTLCVSGLALWLYEHRKWEVLSIILLRHQDCSHCQAFATFY